MLCVRVEKLTELLESNQEQGRALLSVCTTAVTQTAGAFQGSLAKTIRDTFFLEFSQETPALRCAEAIHERLRRIRPQLAPQIGIHTGNADLKDSDLKGDAIDVSARLSRMASAGGIYVSAEVAQRIQNDPSLDDMMVDSRATDAYEIRIQASTSDASSGTRTFLEQIDADQKIPFERFGEMFPGAEKKVGQALEKLSRKGILTRHEQNDGQIVYSLREARDLFKLPRLFEREMEADADTWPSPPTAPHRGFRVAPSVLIGVAVVALVVAIVTEHAFIPVLIVGGAILWTLWKRGKLPIGTLMSDNQGHAAPASGEKRHPTRPPPSDDLAEAQRLKGSIDRRLNNLPADQFQTAQQAQALVREYVESLTKLTDQRRDFQWMLSTMSPTELQRKQQICRTNIESADSEQERQQHVKRLAQIEKQQALLEELQEQQQAIKEKTRAACAVLRRVEAGLAGPATAGGAPSELQSLVLDPMRSEVADLTGYVEQLNHYYLQENDSADSASGTSP